MDFKEQGYQTNAAIDIIAWEGWRSVLFIACLIIAGSVGLAINYLFIRYIRTKAELNRPINNMIIIDQVRKSKEYNLVCLRLYGGLFGVFEWVQEGQTHDICNLTSLTSEHRDTKA